MFQGSFKEVSKVFQLSLKGFSWKFQGSFKRVSREFQATLKGVSSVFQGRFKGFSWVFCNEVSRKFQGSTNKV